mmetsp:Transcript_16690/g.47545  ORF Transcript_16690/g.47545 Transcript_16690/m.47545 type:complete len:204 (-) Transcript_16690:425-1036(-)
MVIALGKIAAVENWKDSSMSITTFLTRWRSSPRTPCRACPTSTGEITSTRRTPGTGTTSRGSTAARTPNTASSSPSSHSCPPACPRPPPSRGTGHSTTGRHRSARASPITPYGTPTLTHIRRMRDRSRCLVSAVWSRSCGPSSVRSASPWRPATAGSTTGSSSRRRRATCARTAASWKSHSYATTSSATNGKPRTYSCARLAW